MLISKEELEHVVVLRLDGELNRMHAKKLEVFVEECIHRRQLNILLDFEHVHHIDSQAILLLLRMNREVLSAGGRMKLLRPARSVTHFMNLGRVLELFERFEIRTEAIRSFKPAGDNGDDSPVRREALRQRAVLIRLVEILIHKGVFTLEELDLAYARAAAGLRDRAGGRDSSPPD